MARSNKTLLSKYAAEIIEKVLTEGDVKHADVDWVTPTVGENLNHVWDHYRQINVFGHPTDEHFEHLVCRAAMAAYKRHLETKAK